MAKDRARVGAAGTFETAAQLAHRGWDVGLTYGNAPRTDLVAQHETTKRVIAVQCKTSTGDQDFLLSIGCESPSPPGRDEWFALINAFGPDERPTFYLMPRNVVAAYLFITHRVWLRGTKKDGSPRNESTMRNVHRAEADPYRERWDLLEGPTADVPYWLPEAVFDWEPAIGLPAGHPGITKPTDAVERPEAAKGWFVPLPA
jgi:hypothetical protein